LKPGDVDVGILPGAVETKVRPAVIIAISIKQMLWQGYNRSIIGDAPWHQYQKH
jgi:hypothetical protein